MFTMVFITYNWYFHLALSNLPLLLLGVIIRSIVSFYRSPSPYTYHLIHDIFGRSHRVAAADRLHPECSNPNPRVLDSEQIPPQSLADEQTQKALCRGFCKKSFYLV